MRWLQSLFMNGYQRALTNPELYRAPVDASEIKEELRGRIRDRETRELMSGAATAEAERRGDGKLTIADVVDSMDSLDWALRSETDRSLHEFGVEARLGASLLADHLIKRANALAKSVKPGATQELGHAFGS